MQMEFLVYASLYILQHAWVCVRGSPDCGCYICCRFIMQCRLLIRAFLDELHTPHSGWLKNGSTDGCRIAFRVKIEDGTCVLWNDTM